MDTKPNTSACREKMGIQGSITRTPWSWTLNPIHQILETKLRVQGFVEYKCGEDRDSKFHHKNTATMAHSSKQTPTCELARRTNLFVLVVLLHWSIWWEGSQSYPWFAACPQAWGRHQRPGEDLLAILCDSWCGCSAVQDLEAIHQTAIRGRMTAAQYTDRDALSFSLSISLWEAGSDFACRITRNSCVCSNPFTRMLGAAAVLARAHPSYSEYEVQWDPPPLGHRHLDAPV